MALCTCTLQREKTPVNSPEVTDISGHNDYFFVYEDLQKRQWPSNRSCYHVGSVICPHCHILLSLDSSKGTGRNRGFLTEVFCMLVFFHIHIKTIPVHSTVHCLVHCHLTAGPKITWHPVLNLQQEDLESLESKLRLHLSCPSLLGVRLWIWKWWLKPIWLLWLRAEVCSQHLLFVPL